MNDIHKPVLIVIAGPRLSIVTIFDFGNLNFNKKLPSPYKRIK